MDIRFLGMSGWINFIWDEINWFVPEFWICDFVSEFEILRISFAER